MPLEQTTEWEDGVVEGKSGYSPNLRVGFGEFSRRDSRCSSSTEYHLPADGTSCYFGAATIEMCIIDKKSTALFLNDFDQIFNKTVLGKLILVTYSMIITSTSLR